MSTAPSAAMRRGLLGAGLLFVLALLPLTAGPDGPPAAAQDMPVVIEDVELVAGCQVRAFMPHYLPGTPLFEIAAGIEGGNPRFWFMHQDPVPVLRDLYDPASPERSVVDVLTEEAGYLCVDFGTVWHRPLWAPPPCSYRPPYCLEPQSPPAAPTPSPTAAPAGCPCANPPTPTTTPYPR